ncbi:hypothetical protein KBY84_08835 [Cyanobium sp. N.Huapi 1H5]|uniref:hypothetical protein n=1 Tax=Cyanobium sp. N.Huapi 1H5 TaxID=2823719 RepID=UPI0020CC77A5|nr:hypothetical protein [Cyanobium sp. N.Huapi 1H5]MCP9837598.1 hypothetical protein [Cyanobium sp. N.Huapi 1H5]
MIIGGLATMPSRRDTAALAIRSILPNVDRLYVYLDRFTSIPPYVVHPKIVLLKSQDFGVVGANGKLLGLASAKPEDFYVCFDDDNFYPRDFCLRLRLMLLALNRSAAVGIHGSRLHRDLVSFSRQRTIFHFAGRRLRPRRVDVLATNGCMFRVGTMQFDVLRWPEINMVDLNFALESALRRVELWILPQCRHWVRPLKERQEDSIFRALETDDSRQTELARQLLSLRHSP